MQPATPDWILETRRRLGDNLRNARLDANLTQEKLALLAGVDRTTLQNAEAGKTDPKLSLLLRLARSLRVPLRDLLP